MATSTTVNDNNTTVTEDITTTTTNATVNLNNSSGSDDVTTDGTGSTTINANNSTGADTFDIDNSGAATVNLNNSTGGDDVSINGTNVTATANLNNSAGNDTITIVGSSSTNATVNLNNSGGNDDVSIGSSTGATTATVNLNSSGGTDIINVTGLTTTATVNLANSTGADDFVELKGAGSGTINAVNSTGNDTLLGENSTDTITGGVGNDTLYLKGAGTINAGAGNDLGIYVLSDHYSLSGSTLSSINGDVDYYYGQAGTNTLVLVLTSAQMALPAVATDIANYNAFLATNPGVNQTYTFHFGAGSGALVVAGWQKLVIQDTALTLAPVKTLVGSAGAATVAFVVSGINEAGTGTLTVTDGAGITTETVTANGTFTFNLSGSAFGDGSVTSSLTFTDGIGNTFTASGAAVTLDKDTGDMATLSLASTLIGSAKASAVSFTISGLDAADTGPGNTGTVGFVEGGQTVTVGVTGDGTYTANLSALADGTVTSSLTFTDVVGNQFSANGANVTLDQDKGESASVAGPSGTLGSHSASAVAFAVTTPDGNETGSLTLTDGTFAMTVAVTGNGTYTENLSSWSDGTVHAALNVSDPAGNSFAASTNVTIDPDFGESASVSGPSGTLGSHSASAVAFAVTTPDGNETGSLTLTDGTFAMTVAVTGNGTYTENLSSWSDGTVHAALNVSDAAGNSFAASTNVTIDPDFGESASVSGPSGTLGSHSASAVAFAVTTPDGNETGSLTLTDGASSTVIAVTGSGVYTENLSSWADGTVSAALNVSDAAGNSFSASTTVAIDPDFGDSASVSGAANTLGSVSASAAAFTVTTPDQDETGSLTLTDGASSTVIAVTGNGVYTENLSSWADGTVSAALNVSDAAGNSFSASTTVAIDPDFGDSASVSGAANTLGSVSASAAAFTVTTPDQDETGSLTLTDGASSTVIAVTGNGVYTENLSSWADGTVSAALNVSDAAGNSFSASTTVAIDPDFGDSASVSGAANTLGSVSASAAAFTVTTPDQDETGSLTLTDGASSTVIAVTGNGVYTENLSSWADGTVSAALNVSDAAGNSFSASTTVAIDPDFGDSASVSGAANTLGSVSASAAAFTVTTPDQDETGSLTLTDGASSTVIAVTGNGVYTENLSSWADGTVSAALNVSDAAGNSFSASTTVAIDPDFGDSASVSGAANTLGSVSASAAAFTVTTPDQDETGSLTLTDGASSTVIAVTGNGVYTENLSSWADGTVSAALNVSDAAGNSFSASTTVAIDPDFGDSASVSGAANTLGSVSASAAAFTVTTPDQDETGSLTLTDGASSTVIAVTGNGVYTENLSSWADGTVSAALNVSDAAGNSFSASTTVAIDPDFGDSASVSGAANTLGSVSASAAAFTVTTPDQDETGSLTLTDGASSTVIAVTGNGVYTENLSSWADGTVSAALNVSDAAGNSFSASTTVAIDPDFGDSASVSGAANTLGSVSASAAAFTVTTPDQDETGSLTLTDGASSTVIAVTGNGVYTENLSSWADGTVSAALNVSDAAGNSFSASTTVAIDPDFGDSASVSGAANTLGSVSASAAAFTVTTPDQDETGSLTLTDGASSTVIAVTGNGVYTENLSSWADGTVSAALNVSDAAGNSFSASTTVAIDPDFGDSASVSGAANTLGSVSASAAAFTVTTPDQDETGSLTLTDGASSTVIAVTGNGVYTENLSSWADGTVSAALNVSDAAGNSFSASTTVAIDPDFGDSASVSGAANTLGSVSASAAAFTVTTPDQDETGSLTLTDGASSTVIAVTGSGVYTENLSSWADGTVSAALNVSDAAGNSFSASTTVAIDPDFGDSASVSGAANTLGSVSASAVAFTVTTPDGNETGSLMLTDGAFHMTVAVTGAGTYTENLSSWTDGTVAAALNVSDAAGNSFAASTNVVIDPDHGETASVAGPGGTLGSVSASAVAFTVTTPDGNETGSLTLTDGASSTVIAVTGAGTYTENLSSWADGTVAAALNVSDAAGNSFAASTNVAIDPDHGETASVAGPGGTLGSVSASAVAFTVTTPDGNETGSLTLTDGASSTVIAVTGAGTYTENLSSWADGTVAAALNVSDAAGNSFAASTNVAIDPDHGETASVAGPGGTLGSVSASAVAFTVTTPDGNETGSLTLTDGASSTVIAVTGAGTYTENLSSWADGTVAAALNVSDAAGNSFAASTNVAIDPDHGETASVAGPGGTLGSVSASAVAFTVTTPDGSETGSLTLTDGASSTVIAVTGAGTYTENLSSWADGTVAAALNVSDAAGNSFAASTNVVIDPDHGETASVAGSGGTLGSVSASAVAFTVTTPDGNETGSLTLTDGASSTVIAVTGAGTYTENLSSWADGTVAAALNVSDAAGNSFAASTNVVTDPDHGETASVAGPGGTLGSVSASAVAFTVTTPDGNETGSLTLTDGASSTVIAVTGAGTYTENLSSWADGTVAASLHVSDAAGNSFAASTNVTIDPDRGETATLAFASASATETVGAETATFTISGIEAEDVGRTETLVFSETGQPAETFSLAPTATSGTYSEVLSFTTAGTVGASLTFTDPAGNAFSAQSTNSVTLVAASTPTLTNVAAKHTGTNKEVTGNVSDPTAGSVTIVAVDTDFGGTAGDTVTLGTTMFSLPANTTDGWSITTTAPATGDTVVVTAHEATGGTATVTVVAAAPAGIAGDPINLALTDPAAGESVTVTVADVPTGWSLNGGTNNNGTWTVVTTDPSTLAVTTPATFAGASVLSVSESWTNPDGSTGSEFVTDNVEAYPASPIFAISGDDTLTGAGANDEFVFAQPIGNDTVYSFNAASDQIDLIGFGISGFAALQPSIADDANGNAVVTLGQNETITLVGIDAAALSASNFVFDQEPITTNTATMSVGDGAMLPLGGTIENTGTIAIDSTGDESDLEILVRGATLQGGGQVVLSDNSENVVFGGDPSAVLTNVDNTISGAGQLGNGQLTLDNKGTIDATGTNALVIDTGANTVTNSGTLEATGAGGLDIKSALASSGTLWANGGNVTVEGAETGGGAAEISGTGILDFRVASDAAVSFDTTAAGTLKLDQSANFSGTVAGLGQGDSLDLADIAFGAGTTIAYTANAAGNGGTLTVSDGTHNANLALLGQYAAAGFQTSADQGGGTVVSYSSQVAQQPLLTNPQQHA